VQSAKLTMDVFLLQEFFPDSSLTSVKFGDSSRFSRQVVILHVRATFPKPNVQDLLEQLYTGWQLFMSSYSSYELGKLSQWFWAMMTAPQTWSQTRSGLTVTHLTAVWEDQGSNPTVGNCRFFAKTTTIYSLGHGLGTLTAVPRSTQPSTLRGMAKWVSAFGLSNNNKWRWWVWLLAAYRRTHSLGHLAWSEGWRPLGAVPYSSYEPGELSQWLWATMTAP